MTACFKHNLDWFPRAGTYPRICSDFLLSSLLSLGSLSSKLWVPTPGVACLLLTRKHHLFSHNVFRSHCLCFCQWDGPVPECLSNDQYVDSLVSTTTCVAQTFLVVALGFAILAGNHALVSIRSLASSSYVGCLSCLSLLLFLFAAYIVRLSFDSFNLTRYSR